MLTSLAGIGLARQRPGGNVYIIIMVIVRCLARSFPRKIHQVVSGHIDLIRNTEWAARHPQKQYAVALKATATTAPIGNTTRDSDCDSGRPFFPVIHTNNAMATGTQKNKAFIRPCVGQQRLPQSRHGSQVQIGEMAHY